MIETVVVQPVGATNYLTLTLTSPERSQGFALVDMTGLGPGAATVNTSDWVTIPGSKVTNVRIPKRTITMDLRFIPTDTIPNVADIRRLSYEYFPLGENVTLKITDRDFDGKSRTYIIDGVVSKNEPSIWSSTEGAAIEIMCPDPMFRDSVVEEFSFDNVKPLFHFVNPDEASGNPYPVGELLDTRESTVYVQSLVQIGATIVLTAYGKVVNPSVYNRTTSELFGLDITMKKGDVIQIDTRPGYKAVRKLEGAGTNIIQYMRINSKWVSLRRGENVIGVRCDEGISNLGIRFTATPLYIGI